MTRKRKVILASAVCGILAPPVMVGLWAVASLLRLGYDQLSQRGSDLTTGPNSAIMNANFLVTGVLILGLSIGLARSMKGGHLLKTGFIVLAVCGIAELVASPFPCDPGCPLMGTTSQVIHTAIAVAFYATVAIFPLLIGLGLDRDPDWQVYRPYSLVTGITSIAFFAVFSVAVVYSSQYLGLVQRLFLSLPFIWIEAMSIRLFSISRRKSPEI